jgi:hypothetical protein
MPTIDLRSVQLAHRRFLSKHEAAVLRELEDARDFGVDYTSKHPGFTPRSGPNSLAKATTGQVIRTKNRGLVRLSNRKPHAAAIDRGAKPHVIRARGKALRFVSRGGVVFRKRVNHPGNKPYRFLSRATNAAGRSFAQQMSARMQTIARSF